MNEPLFDVYLLSQLRPGDCVEARDRNGGLWEGSVDVTDPRNGVFWIHTKVGERKLLDLYEHTISTKSD